MKQVFTLLLVLSSLMVYSQENNANDEILYPPVGFEHPSHLDVYVKVVKCGGIPSLMVTTFNENPKGKEIVTSFQITILDKNGKSEVFNFPKKTYQFGKMLISKCSNLTYNAASTLNWTTDNSNKTITLKFDYEN